MGLTVYDCKKDIRNILVTPQIRARFCRLEPGSGSLDRFHTHDLGHEIFLILSGRIEFKIGGEVKELGPGQMCYALADEPHSVRVIGDGPVYMYLSVTPHIQPGHTLYSSDGERLPHGSGRPATITPRPILPLLLTNSSIVTSIPPKR